ncbi:hypothetical protein G7Y29_07785 [Corynebacterium qintianiae]|uniref:Secreted protein n=1 Tax=Corynebacterium qintianiae TaxID=2709392 RepID=A0A7T0PEG0_9CORY|nr:hypothetical protein [Corynebacterium qintianiae]QPK82770.1 hypothetical protein G7Y29_07785 [Corynebacterium qintianiae]
MRRSLVALSAASVLALSGLPVTANAFELPQESSAAGSAGLDHAVHSFSQTSSNTVGQWVERAGLNPGLFPGLLPVDLPRGGCAPQDFDAVVPGWPNFTGTSVIWCDGQWAIAGANQTDWRVFFHHDGERWNALPPRGTKSTGMQQGCFNGIELHEQGAPQEFVDRAPICTPEEIGNFPS